MNNDTCIVGKYDRRLDGISSIIHNKNKQKMVKGA